MSDPKPCSISGCLNVIPVGRHDHCGQHEFAPELLQRQQLGALKPGWKRVTVKPASAAVDLPPATSAATNLPAVKGASAIPSKLTPSPPSVKPAAAAAGNQISVRQKKLLKIAKLHAFEQRQLRAAHNIAARPDHEAIFMKLMETFDWLWRIDAFQEMLKKESCVISWDALATCLEPLEEEHSHFQSLTSYFTLRGLSYSVAKKEFASAYFMGLSMFSLNKINDCDAKLIVRGANMLTVFFSAPAVAALPKAAQHAVSLADKIKTMGANLAAGKVNHDSTSNSGSRDQIQIENDWGWWNKIWRPQNLSKFTICWLQFIKSSQCPKEIKKVIHAEFGVEDLEILYDRLRRCKS